jgi:hypothetical protein
MDIDRLRDFRNHPFKITADMSMVERKESIEKFGILNPRLSGRFLMDVMKSYIMGKEGTGKCL